MSFPLDNQYSAGQFFFCVLLLFLFLVSYLFFLFQVYFPFKIYFLNLKILKNVPNYFFLKMFKIQKLCYYLKKYSELAKSFPFFQKIWFSKLFKMSKNQIAFKKCSKFKKYSCFSEIFIFQNNLKIYTFSENIMNIPHMFPFKQNVHKFK